MFKYRSGFTLIELLIVVAIISVLAWIIVYAVNIPKTILNTQVTRTNVELEQIYDAVSLYYLANHVWPSDVSRGLPSGLEYYLGPGEWPDAPFNDVSEYDWDNFIGSDGNQVLQISVRFCPLGNSSACKFPNADWAENFDYYSSYYYCIQGICRAHPDKPDDHPGYCMNCGA